ncbi:hypothetical protein KDA23_07795 [Candidatus Saccharibacteria bacterium]|nr:hypothetical protein [Candidatus Saccharibacteria bacterium]
MSTRQPTFKERIRLLDIAAREIEVHADTLSGNQLVQSRLHSTAAIIADEAARMKLAAQRWEQKAPKQPATKKAPTPRALYRAADETCESCQ